jgi:hypothetical protein
MNIIEGRKREYLFPLTHPDKNPSQTKKWGRPEQASLLSQNGPSLSHTLDIYLLYFEA